MPAFPSKAERLAGISTYPEVPLKQISPWIICLLVALLGFAQAAAAGEAFKVQFVDAMGKPIPGLEVIAENYIHDDDGDSFSFSFDWITDPNGHIAVDLAAIRRIDQGKEGYPDGYRITVSHPDYGGAFGRRMLTEKMDRVQHVGLIRRNSLEAERAVRGQVVDEDGRPVPGVQLLCLRAYAPGGQSIRENDKALLTSSKTDAEGRFLLYRASPVPDPGTRGRLVPLGTIHEIRLFPPKQEKLPAATFKINNVAPVRLVLAQPSIDRLVLFEQEDGTWTTADHFPRSFEFLLEPAADEVRVPPAPTALPTYRLGVNRDDGRVQLLPGSYRILGNGTHPVVAVTPDSPDPIRVPRLHRTACRGRVVDAVTGEPLAGALVFVAYGWSGGRSPADLTAEQWDALEAMPRQPDPDDPALDTLSFLSKITLVTTDAEGRYELGLPDDPLRSIYRVYGLARNRMPNAVPNESHADAPGVVNELPDLPLAPAATIEVGTIAAGEVRARLHWYLDPRVDHPAWARELRAALTVKDRSSYGWHQSEVRIPDLDADSGQHDLANLLEPDEQEVPPGTPARLQIPATVPVQLHFPRIGHTPYFGNESREARTLAVGEFVQLPPVEYHRGVTVRVRVVDEQGQPVEGAPVVCRWPDRELVRPHNNADKDGWVSFDINPADGATFEVAGYPDWPEGHVFPDAPERAVTLPPFAPDEEPGPITLTLTAEQEAALAGE